MNNYPKIKINGLNIKSLFLIIFLSKYNYQIYINDSIKLNSLFNYQKKIYTFTNKTKLILQELDLWEKLEKYSYGFNSYSFFNNHYKEEISFFDKNLYSKNDLKGDIGWTLNHEDLEKVLREQLFINKNIYYLKKEKSDFSDIQFDYEFNFGSFNNKNLKHNNILPFNNIDSSSSLKFKVMVRGNCFRRAYEIFLKKESILLIPLAKNIYQVVWKSNYKKARRRMDTDVNLLLDNLSTLLPNGFKLDQIVGEVYFSSNSSTLLNHIKNDKNKFYLNDFNEVSNNLLQDELKSLLFDLKTLQQKFQTKKNFDLFPLAKLKNNMCILKFLFMSNKSRFKNFLTNFFIVLKIFPDLFIKSPLLSFNRNNLIRKFFINSIFKAIFFILIR